MLKSSHVLCRVNDIRHAFKNFSELGFTVQWGSDPAKSHNALIWFEEGPFIEIIQFPRIYRILHYFLRWTKGLPAGNRWLKWADAPEGWCDLALEPTENGLQYDLETIRSRLMAAKVECSQVIKGKRIRPDKKTVRYSFFATHPITLPFIVSAYDPPQRPKSIWHTNGASRISSVRLQLSPEDRNNYNLLCQNDQWIQTRDADLTQVTEVELVGLKNSVRQAMTPQCGACIVFKE